MSAYDITGLLRTADRLFAYCVPSKHPLNTAYENGGVTLITMKNNENQHNPVPCVLDAF